MNTIIENIMNIKSGVIVHQVNCRNRIGAGLSGSIIAKYPKVKEYYHYAFTQTEPKDLFGRYQIVPVSDNLKIVNSFTQFYYGNALKNHRVYTDMDKLVSVLTTLCNKFGHIYVPKYIGCGLAGGDWNELVKRINHLNITVVELPESALRR